MVLHFCAFAFAADLTLHVAPPDAAPVTVTLRDVQDGQQPVIELPLAGGRALRVTTLVAPHASGKQLVVVMDEATVRPNGRVVVDSWQSRPLAVSLNSRTTQRWGYDRPVRAADGTWAMAGGMFQLSASLSDGTSPRVVLPEERSLDLTIERPGAEPLALVIHAPADGPQPAFEVLSDSTHAARITVDLATDPTGHRVVVATALVTRKGRRLMREDAHSFPTLNLAPGGGGFVSRSHSSTHIGGEPWVESASTLDVRVGIAVKEPPIG